MPEGDRDASRPGIAGWAVDPRSGKLACSPEFERLHGIAPGDAPDSLDGYLARYVDPADAPVLSRALRGSLGVGGLCQHLYRIHRDDGTQGWLLARWDASPASGDGLVPLFCQDVTAIVAGAASSPGVGVDLGEALLAARAGAWSWDVRTGEVRWSPEMYDLTGVSAATCFEDGVPIEVVHPNDLDELHLSMAAAVADRAAHWRHEYRIRHPARGLRWLSCHAAVRWGPDGRPVEMLGIAVDVTDRRDAEERRQVLLNEVDHRARNLLSVVQGLVRLTQADTVHAFREAVEGRLAALGHAHRLLTEARWQGAELHRLVAEELTPYEEGERVTWAGPRLLLLPEAAQSLAMALHELATNAIKHGALSRQVGLVRLTWRVAEDGISLLWEEAGGPAIPGPPLNRGVGGSVIQATIVQQLNGTVLMGWEPGGLRCTLRLPMQVLALPVLAAQVMG